jgi:hypothetical protein
MTGLGGTEPGQGQGIQGGLGRGRELPEALGEVAVQVQERVREQFPRVEAGSQETGDDADPLRVTGLTSHGIRRDRSSLGRLRG